MVVDHRREQVVRRADSVHVAGEMKVNIFHWDDLSVAAAGGTAFHAEARASDGSRTQIAAFADPVQRRRDRRWSWSCLRLRGGRNRGDQDQFAARAVEISSRIHNPPWPYSTHRRATLPRNFQFCADVGDGKLVRGAHDFDIRTLIGHVGVLCKQRTEGSVKIRNHQLQVELEAARSNQSSGRPNIRIPGERGRCLRPAPYREVMPNRCDDRALVKPPRPAEPAARKPGIRPITMSGQ